MKSNLVSSFHRSILVSLFILLSSFSQARTLNIDSFGAQANDGQNDSAALKALMNQLRSGDTIKFSAGTYDFYGYGSNDYLIELRHKNNINIMGATLSNGAPATTTVIHDIDSVFIYAFGTNDLTIKNLVIRRTPVPYSQATVSSVTNSSVTVKLQNGFKPFTDSLFISNNSPRPKVNFNFTLAADKKRIKWNTNQTYYPSSISGSGQSYKLNASIDASKVSVGDGVILRRLTNGWTVNLNATKRTHVQNVTVGEAPSLIFKGIDNEEVSFDKIKTAYFGNQWTTSNGDGIHLGSTRGTSSRNRAVKITNSVLDGLGDDAVALWNRKNLIYNVETSNTFLLADSRVAVGDLLHFFRPSTGALVGEGYVRSTSYVNGKDRVVLDRAISGVRTSDIVFNDMTNNNYFFITNSTFKNGRRSALAVRGKNGYILRNNFINNGIRGIETSSNSSTFFTGIRLANTSIVENYFRGLNGINHGAPAMIFIKTPKTGGGTAQWRANTGNTIVRNTFNTYHGATIRIEAGENLLIKQNKAETVHSGFLKSSNHMIYLKDSHNITLLDNDYRQDFRNHNACVQMVNSSNVSFTANDWPSSCPDSWRN